MKTPPKKPINQLLLNLLLIDQHPRRCNELLQTFFTRQFYYSTLLGLIQSMKALKPRRQMRLWLHVYEAQEMLYGVLGHVLNTKQHSPAEQNRSWRKDVHLISFHGPLLWLSSALSQRPNTFKCSFICTF